MFAINQWSFEGMDQFILNLYFLQSLVILEVRFLFCVNCFDQFSLKYYLIMKEIELNLLSY